MTELLYDRDEITMACIKDLKRHKDKKEIKVVYLL